MTEFENLQSVIEKVIYKNSYHRLDNLSSDHKVRAILAESIFRQEIENQRANFREQLYHSIENFKEEYNLNENQNKSLDDLFDSYIQKFNSDCNKHIKDTLDYFQVNGKEIYKN